MIYRYLLLVALQFPFLVFGQKYWQKVDPSIASGALRAKATNDSTYNYGSENLPSPRIDMISWADPAGGVWIYGGIGYDENKQWGIFSDLWKYNAAENKWNLIWGERNKASDLEKQPSDAPVPRKEASAWRDDSGRLWLFGGRQYNELFHLDDLWFFEPSANKWVKQTGTGKFNQKPSRGAIKQASKQFSPGGRSLASSWVDKKGNLWLFGGLSYTPDQDVIVELYSDLWMFDTKKEEWQWVSGKDKPNQPHKYEMKNQQSAENVPTPRASSAQWFDQSSDRLFLYGGIGYDSSASKPGGLSDMWVYDINKDHWDRVLGDSFIDKKFKVENHIASSKNNSPGYRISPIHWTGQDGTFYLMGGQNTFTQDLVDIEQNLWAFEIKTGQWRFIPQKDVTIISSAAAFDDNKGSLYMFGGKEFDHLSTQSRPSNQLFKLSQ